MIDGQDHPDSAGAGGGDGRGERGPAAGSFLSGLGEDLEQTYPGGEWLKPAWGLLAGGFEMLDKARVVLTVAAVAVVLVYVGAKVEREMQRRELRVLDGAAEADNGDRG